MAKLAAEWRATLFPDATDAQFADGYAQTFAYALLLARLEGSIPPIDADKAAKALGVCVGNGNPRIRLPLTP